MSGQVLCRYVFCGAEEDEPSSVLVGPPSTVQMLHHVFPFEGKYHFRIQEASGAGYIWRDLIDENEPLPANHVLLKVLQLSAEPQEYPVYSTQVDAHEYERYRSFFQNDKLQSGNKSKANLNSMWKNIKATSKEQFTKTSAKVWETVEFTAGRYFNSQSGAEKPSAAALQNLSNAGIMCRAIFSESNREHMELLRRLWAGIYGENRPVEWRAIGFSTDEPLTILQNTPSSVWSIHAMAFFAEVHRTACLEMLPARPAYAFAMVGLHLGALLADLLDLPTGRFVEREEVYWHLFEDPIGLLELFCMSFHAYDSFHRQSQGSFQSAMELTKEFICQVLLRGPRNIEELVHHVHQVRSVVLH
ncbi:hypothetical protein THRCLA_22499 [Thraustotheca clavata]|uniref:ELMO domain-containing protein n=1 Tax=Thraustotheca clavata TaxID=74557 RepID=A0A1V9YZ35_9STRA|nr:hypothetical protein THRCLA_22499 [Thraustotheca clavata]